MSLVDRSTWGDPWAIPMKGLTDDGHPVIDYWECVRCYKHHPDQQGAEKCCKDKPPVFSCGVVGGSLK